MTNVLDGDNPSLSLPAFEGWLACTFALNCADNSKKCVFEGNGRDAICTNSWEVKSLSGREVLQGKRRERPGPQLHVAEQFYFGGGWSQVCWFRAQNAPLSDPSRRSHANAAPCPSVWFVHAVSPKTKTNMLPVQLECVPLVAIISSSSVDISER